LTANLSAKLALSDVPEFGLFVLLTVPLTSALAFPGLQVHVEVWLRAADAGPPEAHTLRAEACAAVKLTKVAAAIKAECERKVAMFIGWFDSWRDVVVR
jgi:hypothetical protein